MAEINISDFPAQITLNVYKGDTVSRDITIREDGSLANLSSDSFAMRITDHRGTPILNLSVGSGIAHVSTGKIRFTITAAQTAAITATKIRTDLEWTRASDGREKTLFRSTGIVTSDITP